MSATPALWYEFRNALHGGEFARAAEMLKATPALLHLANRLGETALHFLAVENDQKSVAWLHARGADINTKNTFGTPVIFEVAQLDYRELFRWFVEQGVDVHAHDAEGQDLVEHLLAYQKDEMAAWVRKNGA